MKIETEAGNPWAVDKVEDFLHYHCPECDLQGKSKDDFVNHAFDKHPKSKEYPSIFAIKLEDTGEDDPHQIVCTELTDIKDESNTIDVESRNSYLCEICEECFLSFSKLALHIQNAHANEEFDNEDSNLNVPELYPCDICLKSYSKYNLKRHIGNFITKNRENKKYLSSYLKKILEKNLVTV